MTRVVHVELTKRKNEKILEQWQGKIKITDTHDRSRGMISTEWKGWERKMREEKSVGSRISGRMRVGGGREQSQNER